MISVVIPTFNRVELLKKAVESILCQNYSGWELIVVDNNSSDGTQEYMEAICSTDPRVQYIRENRQGLSYAKNSGAASASMDIIAILDDDEIASPDWLGEILDTFSNKLIVGCVGGRTVLENKDQIPYWISPKLYNCLGEWNGPCDADKPVIVGRVDFMGGNMAFRKTAFYKVGRFNENLGRKGGVLLAGEDTELCYKMHDAGYTMIYNPRAIVYHQLISSRMTISYFRKNAQGCAYTRIKKEKMFSFILELIYRWVKLPLDILRLRHLSYALFRLCVAFYKLEGTCRLHLGKL